MLITLFAGLAVAEEKPLSAEGLAVLQPNPGGAHPNTFLEDWLAAEAERLIDQRSESFEVMIKSEGPVANGRKSAAPFSLSVSVGCPNELR